MVIFPAKSKKTKIADKTEDLSQNHSLKCKIDGPQFQIAKTPAEWKGDMKQGNKLQSVLVNFRKGKTNQAQVGKVYQSIQYDVAFPLCHTRLLTSILRPDLT